MEVSAYRVPTDAPEADGTIQWDHTTLVLVELEAGGERGLGFSYSSEATARLLGGMLAHLAKDQAALAPAALQGRLDRAVRNVGRPGIASHAISAIDVA
ncbi:MAG TPA: mandelate racemase, partial [Vulgatibacter sp.]